MSVAAALTQARVARLLTGALVAAALSVATMPPAAGGPGIPSIPQVNAVDTTPRVVDDATVTEAGVRELRQVGSTMYAGGHFTRVQNAARTASYTRTNLFSFNTATSAVTSFAPAVNGEVLALEPSADNRFLYVGGDFTSFGGASVNRLVRYDLVNNRVDTTFRFPVAAGRVSDLQLVGGRLFVGGTFPGGVVSVNPGTGARDGYFDATQATGAEQGYSTRIYRFAVNPARTRMVVIGSFTAIGGRPRQQAAMLTLGASIAGVSGWSSTRWNEDCSDRLRFYTRDVDFAPDGGSFAIVTTGGGYPGTPKLCDTVTRWATTDSANQQPTWINHSGGDTFHSVAYTDKAVFASGHIRWLDNPLGRDTKGPGAVDRLGIGAIDPTTGKATSWNPTKSVEGGLGGFDLYVTGQGLWVGHFERLLGTGPNGREVHEGLGLLPF
ncbi:MAG TPA: hypothetical protein VER39_07120 [Nocardioidaceae bacterium]|nr:hypothetical protein [Nocardioidaceae bacterium]